MQRVCRFHTVFIFSQLTSAVSVNKFKDSQILHIKPAPLTNHDDNDLYLTANSHHNQQQQHSKSGTKKSLTNHEILRSLGMTQLTIPPSHHRKRLAVESRHHARPDDSHMFVIKLPPNPVYYTNQKLSPVTATGSVASPSSSSSASSSLLPSTSSSTAHDKNSVDDKNKKVSVDFKSNGKPGRIYHWNLPVLKKMFGVDGKHNGRNSISRHSNDVYDLIDIKHIPTWSKPWENETIEKSFHKDQRSENDVNYKSKSPTYYAPRPKKSYSSVHKYFPGNGKPKSFYIINKKSQKPTYQKLIP